MYQTLDVWPQQVVDEESLRPPLVATAVTLSAHQRAPHGAVASVGPPGHCHSEHEQVYW